MKLRLISVGRLPWYRREGPLFFFYTPRLGLPSLAAVTPPDWEVAILDGVQLDEIDFADPVDLVGFSVLTPFANDSYRAADRYRERGVIVVMGGVHPTLMPDEAALHADAVVVGEGESVWPDLLLDVERGELKRRYVAETPLPFDALPRPRYDLLRGDYPVARGIQVVRGCPHGSQCPFCVVPRLFGTQYRVMPITRAIDEIRACAAERDTGSAGVNLSACCALNHRDYIRPLAGALTPLGIRWCGGGLLDHLNDDSLLDLLRDSGCECVYTESAVASARKNPRRHRTYVDVARRILDRGMVISYNFTVGLDEDTREVFDDVQSFINATGLRRDLCAIQLFAPWPGTEVYERLEAEGRIIDRDWSRYDNINVVFKPRQMTIAELDIMARRRATGQ